MVYKSFQEFFSILEKREISNKNRLAVVEKKIAELEGQLAQRGLSPWRNLFEEYDANGLALYHELILLRNEKSDLLDEIQIGLNFPDADGYMLIHYAISENNKKAVEQLIPSAFHDLNNLPRYANKIKANIFPQSPLDFALNNHYFDMAELLYDKCHPTYDPNYQYYAPYTDLLPYQVVVPRIYDEQGLAWIEAKTKTFIADELTNHIQGIWVCQVGDLNKFRKFIEKYKQATEACSPVIAVGLLAALQYHKRNIIEEISANPTNREMLLRFCKNHPSGPKILNEHVRYALLDGSKPALDLLKFLISEFKLDLSSLKFGSYTLMQLMGVYHAIEGIKFLLDNNIRGDKVDEYNNTILHYLDNDTRKLLLSEKPELSILLKMPNLFGKIAGEISAGIEQSLIAHQFYRYFIQQGRTLGNYSTTGMCNGLSFLFELNASKGNTRYFTAILSEIASWDGKLKDLDGHSLEPINPLLKYNKEMNTGFKMLEELFERFYNDISLFLHLGETEKAITMREGRFLRITHQLDRNSQLALIADNTRVRPIFYENNFACTRDRLISLLQFIQTLPHNIQVDLNTPSHLCALTKTSEGDFLLYNPDVPSLFPPIKNPEQLADIILQTDYVRRGEIKEDGTFCLNLYVHCFNHNQASFLQEAKEYTKKIEFSSQDLMTQLRYCIVTKQNDKVKELLQNNPQLLNQEDKFGKTPLDYALYSLNDEIAQLLLLMPVDVSKGESLGLIIHSIGYENNTVIFNALSFPQLNLLNQKLSSSFFRDPLEQRIRDRMKELSISTNTITSNNTAASQTLPPVNASNEIRGKSSLYFHQKNGLPIISNQELFKMYLRDFLLQERACISSSSKELIDKKINQLNNYLSTLEQESADLQTIVDAIHNDSVLHIYINDSASRLFSNINDNFTNNFKKFCEEHLFLIKENKSQKPSTEMG